MRALLGIKWRIGPLLALVMMLVIAAFITAITVVDINRTEDIFWEELEVRGTLLADGLNELLADAIYFQNVDEMGRIAAIIDNQHEVNAIQIFTPEGRVLVDTRTPRFSVVTAAEQLGRQSLASGQRLVQVRNGTLAVSRPITAGDEVLGGLWIDLGSEALRVQIRAIIVEHVWQGLILMAIGIVASYLVARYFTRPIRKLVQATKKMAAGQLDTRVDVTPVGELGELAHSFNSMAQELESQVAALQESRSRIVQAQEGVREEIAAHLHGRVQGKLLVLKGRLQNILDKSPNHNEYTATLQEVTHEMEEVIQQELSILSRRLYPSILRRGLVPALQSLGDQFEAALTIDMQLDNEFARQERTNRNLVAEPVRLVAYRIAEESLTNVVKHARASRVVVRLEVIPGAGLKLVLKDDGQGFDMAAAAGGMGMAALQDYAGAVGGKCTVYSVPGQGTEIVANLPLGAPVAASPATSGPWG